MEGQITPLEWKKNPVYISGGISGIFLIIVILLFYFKVNPNLQIAGVVALIVVGGITFLFYQSQCPKCKRIFSLKKISDEVIKEWEEPKQSKEKTIYYYSDGFTEKDVKYGATKDFTARFEKHKDGFNCKRCGETHYKTRDVFLNKNDWLRVTTPNKVTTSTKPPKVDMSFGLEQFEPTYYEDKSGKRIAIPKKVKMDLWEKYFGRKKAEGQCFVCSKKIHISQFEAGHVVPASKNGSDKINNLRPICRGCNGSMGNRNLYEYKKSYGY